jgi:NitT/TauT family transport system substrate-binding protein
MRSASLMRIAALVAGLTLLGPVTAGAAEQKFTIATAADSLQYIVQDVAIDGGFFAKEGLVADPVIFDSGTRQSAAIMSGGGTIGPVGLIHTIKASAAGGSLVAVCRLFDVLDVFIVMSNDAIKKTGITSDMPMDEKMRRMRGLRIAITGPGSTVDTSVRALFKARGMDPDKEVQLQPLGAPSNMIAAMEKGATDAFAYPAPWPSIAASRGLGKVVVDPFVDNIPETRGVPFNIMAVSRDLLAKDPGLVSKMVRGYTRAMKFIADDPEGAKKMIRKRFPDLDEKVFDSLWASYRKAVATDPVISTDQFYATQKWLNLTTSPPLAQKYEQVVSSDAAKAAERDILGK